MIGRPVAVVTGGASGIGRAFSELWIERGGDVVLLDLDQAVIDGVVAELGDAASGHAANVTSRESVDAAYEALAEKHPRVNAVVNCAGIARPSLLVDQDDAGWALMLDIHLGGTMRSSRAAYPLLKAAAAVGEVAAVVNISSMAGHAGTPGRASYSTAKAGLSGLTRTLAVEWASDSIRVNAISPGYIMTKLTEDLIARGDLNIAPAVARTPLRRFGNPQEVAATIAFLCSADASYITGHDLVIDGGMTIEGDWFS